MPQEVLIQSLQKFLEYKRTYSGELKIFECLLAEKKEERELIIIYKLSEAAEFIGVRFEPGCISFGYYWKERNYNAYHWKDPLGKTLLIYFNICKDTVISENKVEWTDLVVDVALFPDGSFRVLDLEEIPDTMEEADLETIDETKAELCSNLEKIALELETKTSELLRRRAF